MLDNINPDGKQKEVLALPPIGHTVVLGTAGSGKTTMALLRAIGLANLPEHQNVLVVTFNRALVKYMEHIIQGYSPNITIESYHKFARGYLNSLNKMPRSNGIADNDIKLSLISDAIKIAKEENPTESTFNRPLAVFVDEITFLERFGFENYEDYYHAERIGRASANIKRDNRKLFYHIYELYKRLRDDAGYNYDWDDLAVYVYRELLTDPRPRRYSHIIVDEGQDFSPAMIRSLTTAISPDGSFTFFGDVAQQIYGSRLTWRDSGINIKDNKIWRFDRNYRNPNTIVEFARDITNSEYWDDNIDMVKPSNMIAEGPKPVLVGFSSRNHELSWLVQQVRATKNAASNLVVFRDRATIGEVNKFFSTNGISTTVINKEHPGFSAVKGVYLSTFHSAKGMEFDNVYIPFLSNDIFPEQEAFNKAIDKSSMLADELKLLYVAVTRSKYGLFMSYHGEVSSLFPTKAESYDYYNGEELS